MNKVIDFYQNQAKLVEKQTKNSLLIKAPAKVNLTLEILNKRTDGYHELMSIASVIDFYDIIKISFKKKEKANQASILFDSNIKNFDFLNHNNVVKAARQFLLNFAPPIYNYYRINIYLNKQIPVGSGLGGSSTDIVGVVYTFIQLFKIKINARQLMGFFNSLGSDLLIFYYSGMTVLSSRGDQAKRITGSGIRAPILLVLNYNKIYKTKDIFDSYKLKITKKPGQTLTLLKVLKNQPDWLEKIAKLLYNDLEKATRVEQGYLKTIKQNLLQQGALGTVMSGSGPSVMAIFKNNNKLKKAYKNLKVAWPDLTMVKLLKK
ncbi:MAG: 4-(cytidine 5'-diphospho)-2-C-methyl-D-erythritol kinase [Candidatus Moranbacteria bacterium]|nr:4-(cytidine 5'-diphospho)-2-C-methyl-D-erythritol kinase [Candidatus Moranbacteria bacterium]